MYEVICRNKGTEKLSKKKQQTKMAIDKMKDQQKRRKSNKEKKQRRKRNKIRRSQ